MPLSAVEAALGINLADARERHARLTKREAQVAAWVAAGIPSAQIVKGLGLSRSTLGNHCARIMTKLGADTSAGVANVVNLLRLSGAADGSGL
jgi:DNA-binding CsgD family transcriptional regulator